MAADLSQPPLSLLCGFTESHFEATRMKLAGIHLSNPPAVHVEVCGNAALDDTNPDHLVYFYSFFEGEPVARFVALHGLFLSEIADKGLDMSNEQNNCLFVITPALIGGFYPKPRALGTLLGFTFDRIVKSDGRIPNLFPRVKHPLTICA